MHILRFIDMRLAAHAIRGFEMVSVKKDRRRDIRFWQV